MNTATLMEVPCIETRGRDDIGAEGAAAFRASGLLILRGLLRGDELTALRRETLALVQQAERTAPGADPDIAHKRHALSGASVPFRIEYVVDKSPACRALAGHPFILRSVERLQGRNFIPTWDSCVFKNAGAGAAIPWHRDAGREQVGDSPIFNVDFYLDEADLSNCLWGFPGSHEWPQDEADARLRELNRGGEAGAFETQGALPIPLQPGDVLLHNILALHGSPACRSQLRRVLYFEYRPVETELRIGPHTPAYIPLKQRVLQACLKARRAAGYAAGEKPYRYEPLSPFQGFENLPEPASLRYPHAEYWRESSA